MTTIHHFHLTRDRDGQVSLHNQQPQQDWLGYWATPYGETDNVSGGNVPAVLASIIAPYVEKLGYDKPIDLVITVQEE